MTNPVPRSPMFATPADMDALDKYIQRLPLKDQTEAYRVMMMTLNLAHRLVETAAEEAKGAW